MADIKVNQQTGELAVRQGNGKFKIYQPGQYKFNRRTNQYAVPGDAVNGAAWKLYDATGTVGPTKGNATAPTVGAPGESVYRDPSDLPAGERFQQGVVDIGQGVLELLDKSGIMPYNLPGGYTAAAAKQRAGYEERRKEAGGSDFDAYRLAGNSTALAPAAAAIPADVGYMSALGLGALGGGMMGALTPTEPDRPFGEQKAEQIGLGMATGAGTGVGLRAVSGMIAPNLRPEVQALLGRGVNPTPGQLAGGVANQLEEKLATTIPGLGDMITTGRRGANDDFQRAIYNEVLQPIGAQVGRDMQPGRDAIRAVEQTIRDQYAAILPHVNLPVDPPLANAVANLRARAANNLPPEQARRFEQIVTQKVGTRLRAAGGTLDGDTFKGVESELSNDIRGYRSDPSHDNRELADYLGELLDEMRQGLERNNPMFADQLRAANASWARFTRLQRAAGAVGNDMGDFTPQQFSSAVKAMDNSVRKGAYARGDALMQELSDAGRSVLANKFPNSGTPGRIGAALLLGGGLSQVSPGALMGAGLASIPYTALGRRAVGLLARPRPRLQGLSNMLPRAALPAGAASAGALIQGQ